MMPENATYAYVGALVDELVRLGVEHLCLCPGSRSTPVALSAARHPGMRIWTLIDERSAAFFALGMARGLRGPVALLSTSGTAAANFLPAVVEARYSRVPLIVLTADRPHELRESGASQAIDQVRLYGTHVKWFLDLALPEASDGALRYVRTVTGQAVAIAADAPSGPVHLNVPLREPLVPIAEAGGLPPDRRSGPAWEGREAGRPYAAWSSGLRALQPDLIKELAALLGARPRGVIVCGPSDDPVLPGAVSRLAAALGYPVLADPLSQVRCGPHDRHFVIDAYDPVLRSPGVAARLAPQAVVRFGGVPASKPLLQYLEMHDAAHQVVIDAGGGWHDPMRLAARFVHADPSLLCQALAAALPTTAPGNAAWAETWRRLSGLARGVLQECLEHVAEPFEGRVFSELATLLPEGAVLYVGNSMPVRDLDSFFPGSPRAIRVLGNRGASGIDGLVSSALGVAASGTSPVVLVVGDLAFYHDMNGLLAAKLHRLRATIVLINNDGGGIFSFLPQADYPEHFEALFGTPHGLEFRWAAELYGAAFARADTWETFRAQVRQALGAGGLSIVEVRTRRDRNVILHQEMWAAVDAAIRGALSAPAVRGTD